MPASSPSTHPQPACDQGGDADACYRALTSRDARFDGRFFTGVTSTGIYCRPVCKVRTPKRENCRFFTLAAQAESAGFRPCLRCRPELAPASASHLQAHLSPDASRWSLQDASAMLARQAAALLDASALQGEDFPDAAALAQRLGVSERHLRRIFGAQWGVSPLQYVQTKRLLAAKQWLTDTHLPMAKVAAFSGFGSVRRFHAAFVAHYRMQPSALRASAGQPTGSAVATPPARARAGRAAPASPGVLPTGLQLKAHYRPPYDVDAMLGFFALRCLPGVESVDLAGRSYARTWALRQGDALHRGWVRATFASASAPNRYAVELCVSDSLAAVLPRVLSGVRALLDLDADPGPINACMLADFAGTEGLRVPGTVDGFELAVRAVLGQQVTVAAARTLTTRLVAHWGSDLPAPLPGLNRCFPSAEALADASAEALGSIGIVRQRQQALRALACAVAQGRLALHPGAPVDATVQALQALPGIGPWTAQYIAMRALRWPDAWLAGDVALQNALGLRVAGSSPATAARATELASARWRPWRSYAVVRAWSQAHTQA